MKNFPLSIIFIIFILIAFNISNTQDAEEWSSAEQQLWKLEQNYMQYYKDKNIDSLKTFYHKKFTGWPQYADMPVDVSAAMKALRMTADIRILSFKIRPQNIVLHDNTAIVYYYIDVDYEAKDNTITTVPTRLIHTWLKENGRWQILGGMSNR